MRSLRHNDSKIPIVIGVTGHRDLRAEDTAALEAAVRAQLVLIRETYPHSPLQLMTGLAEGGDQLCARVAHEMGIEYLVPMPWAADVFREDFAGEALAAFEALLAGATHAYVARPTEPFQDTSAYAYRQVGIHVARHCHVLLALWDGRSGTAEGCGTAETVAFMRTHQYASHADCLHLPQGGAVLHIVTPRRQNPDIPNVGDCTLLEDAPGALDALLSRTDAFNKASASVAHIAASTPRGLDTLGGENPGIERLRRLRLTASELSKAARNRYHRTLRSLAALSVASVLSFLLYDNLESNLFLPLYGGFLLIAFVCVRRVRRDTCHLLYLEYRGFAEALRIQVYLLLAGVEAAVTEDFPWSEKIDMAWAYYAINALLAGAAPGDVPAGTVASCWIEEQIAYHRGKLGRVDRQLRRNERMTLCMIALTALVYVLICVVEVIDTSLMDRTVTLGESLRRLILFHEGQDVNLRSMGKAVLGVASAITLFLSSYYGKLSLAPIYGNSATMASLFERARQVLAADCVSGEALLRRLAREEMIENNIWLSHMRENEPAVEW